MEDDKKKKRKRLKEICKQIRQQMEFYFSDSNLHKDRFLKKQIDQTEDGWLELEMFGRFNKLKSITTDMQLVAKALSTSELLQVSDDAKKVKRKVPLNASSNPKDVDERTIYVECLPSEADHEWVKSVFSPYGKVLYVSLPKYKSTGDIKGFAFVEFEKMEDANHACEEMNKETSDKPDKIGKFPTKGCKDIQRLQKQLSAQKSKRGQRNRTVSETEVTERKAQDAREEQLKKSGRKRSRLWSQGSGQGSDNEFSSKKMKIEEPEKNVSSDDSSSSDSDSDEPVVKKSKQEETGVTQKRKLEKKSEDNADDGLEPSKKKKTSSDSEIAKETDADESQKTSKKNKRKKKVRDDKKNLPDLKVIPKIEWLKLRNEYIKLQKNNMKKLKASWKKVKENQSSKGADLQGNEMESTDSKENDQSKTNKKPSKGNNLEFKADVIVYVQSETEIVRKKLKEELSAFGEVAYIDVIDGDKQAHVRCESAEAAKKISNASLEHVTFSVLKGDEEKNYWDKILKDREEKLNSKSKPKRRGKDKTIAKVAAMKEALNKKTHVFFDDT